ncbi:zinc finger protein 572-like [Penaeus indicus]|uniref:zinc finger protein 572-like n=1 Tax=Penaeus indicus TaxID=29960 RepID=UPI00300C709F
MVIQLCKVGGVSTTLRCPCCGYSTTSRRHMELHVATHTGEKPFACPHCPFRAVHSANLKTHIRTHTGEKPFACPYCPYSAAQKEKLKAHIRTHTGEKPFACEYCPYRSTRKDHLKSHFGFLNPIENVQFSDVPSTPIKYMAVRHRLTQRPHSQEDSSDHSYRHYRKPSECEDGA